MARAIPVFAFVFAAFAATLEKSAAGPNVIKARSLRRRSPSKSDGVLLETWRSLWRRRISVAALVAVEAPDHAGPAAVWVTDIAERRSGLTGLVLEACDGLSGFDAGAALEFDISDVVNWRIAAAALAKVHEFAPTGAPWTGDEKPSAPGECG